ncbi:MAG TPA: nucleotidyltransferase [Chloroflexi bacterium]|nr:MAG: hypothetical protein B6243_13950 [Anaerolineaceae bacterium 4572_5.2]HEY84452.1 nucleotidyltransferase [Chloroflexota bacterium]
MKFEQLVYALDKLEAAFLTLQQAVERTQDDLDQDGVIHRFEFTFELLWKTTKIFLQYEGFHCAGPRSCIKEGARTGLLLKGELLLDMLNDRNKTTHVYDQDTAQEIFERIKRQYLSSIAANIQQFRGRIS